MSKLSFKLLPPGDVAHERRMRRQRVQSCPRLESLEGRVMMSTFQVNTTLDTMAVNLRTGKDATGHISLRSAIMAADARGGSNTIDLRNGTYNLTIAGANDDASATGDLDITGNLTIKGSGSRRTIIDGNNLDRVIEVLHGKVTISGVTIRHGMAKLGGGIFNSGGQVSLSSVMVAENRAVGADGAVGNGGGLLGGAGGNGGNGLAGLGGGIFNGAGSLSISKSTISANQSIGGNGGQGGNGGLDQGLSQADDDGQNGIGRAAGHGGDGAAARWRYL